MLPLPLLMLLVLPLLLLETNQFLVNSSPPGVDIVKKWLEIGSVSPMKLNLLSALSKLIAQYKKMYARNMESKDTQPLNTSPKEVMPYHTRELEPLLLSKNSLKNKELNSQ